MRKMRAMLLLTIGMSFTAVNSASAEEVYVMRGFLNRFSKGMNVLHSKLKRQGINSYLYGDGKASKIKKRIIDRVRSKKVSYPIILIGHSAAGVSLAKVANELGQKGIKVSIIGVDPGFKKPPALGRNIEYAMAYKVRHPLTYVYKRGRGFTGRMDSENVTYIESRTKALGHTDVDKSVKVQNLISKDVREIIRSSVQ